MMQNKILLAQIVALSLKYWYQFQIEEDDQIWINLIFIDDYYRYQVYCEKIDVYEQLLCEDMKKVGILCFVMIVAAICLLVLEIIRLFIYLNFESSSINKKLKGKILQGGSIIILCCAYLGYFAVILSLFKSKQHVKFIGFSFWLGSSSALMIILISIYYRKTKGSSCRNEYMQKYIQFDKLRIDGCESFTD